MNAPLIIDSFAGGGGASEGIRAAIGRDPDYALNHDRLALAMHRINHPGTKHIEEDVWNVDAIGLCAGRDVGLLWMSPDCFPAGTLVLTQTGYHPIESIAVGDLVLTHAGRWRPVTETSRARRPLMLLCGHGHPGLPVSPEHPFYARQRTVEWDNEKERDVPTYSAPEWVPASALNTGAYRHRYENGRKACLNGGSYWGTPMSFPAIDIPSIGGRSHPIDPDLMWLAGRYVGDGWTRLNDTRAELVITCGKHEVEHLRSLLDRWQRAGVRAGTGGMTWHERAPGTAYGFSTNHRGLVIWLREHFGHRAEAKGIPAWALGMPEDLRRGLLEGYLSADGSRKANRVECTTVSKALAFGIKALATSLGFIPTVYLSKNTADIAGRMVKSRPAWHVRWRDPLGRRQVIEEDGIQWSPIRARTEPAGETDVFNIGVEGDESYVVEGVIVHNCKHFSKAKGGKPREKAIRGLAWVGVRWIKSLPKRQRPRLVFLENVEEFQDWGPLLDDGRPCPVQRGATFKQFVLALEAMGYVVEWRELRACDYGAPTIRKRLFLIARRDGKPIVWPKPTHAPLSVSEDGIVTAWAKGHGLTLADVQSMKLWRTAAECIDWSLPCPSIFESSAEIKAKYGIRANRPLAAATMARIAKGTMRYVVNSARPFLVQVNHGGGAGGRAHGVEEPASTFTGGRGEALVQPFVTYGQQGGGNRDAGYPLHTICASPKDQNAIVTPFVTRFNSGATGHEIDRPLATVTSHASETHGGGAAPLGVVAPVLVVNTTGHTATAPDEPLSTVTTGGHHMLTAPFLAPRTRPMDLPAATITASDNVPGPLIAPHLIRVDQTSGDPARKGVHAAHVPATTITAASSIALVSGCLVPRYSERAGQDPRARSVEEPAPVIVPTGNEGSLAAVHLQKHYGKSIGQDTTEPTHTLSGRDKVSVVAAHLARDFGMSVGSAADEPAPTVMPHGQGKTKIVAAFLAQHNTARDGAVNPGTDARVPVSTITAAGGHQNVVAAHLLNLRGSDRRDAPADRPAPTATGGGNHAAAVYAFLAKYYGEGLPSQAADEPLHTVTAKPRHGVVTVTIQGQPYVIVDIGMRMLTPRERFNAQGFRSDYVIDSGELEDGSIVPLTLEQQGRMCGNSVCPQMAEALVAANYREADARVRPAAQAAAIPLFAAE